MSPVERGPKVTTRSALIVGIAGVVVGLGIFDLTEGDVVLWCPVGNHRELGMEATVAVGEGGGAPAEDTTTGDEDDGVGGGVTILEPFVSLGQVVVFACVGLHAGPVLGKELEPGGGNGFQADIRRKVAHALHLAIRIGLAKGTEEAPACREAQAGAQVEAQSGSRLGSRGMAQFIAQPAG